MKKPKNECNWAAKVGQWRSWCLQKHGSPAAAFRKMDVNKNGSVSFVIDESNLKGGRSRQKFWLGGAAPQTPQFLAGGAKPPQTPP